MSDDEIAAIREGRFDGFPPAEVALLRMADALSDTPSNVSDELYAEFAATLRGRSTHRARCSGSAGKLPRALQPRFRCGPRRTVSKGVRFKERSVAQLGQSSAR